MKEKLVGGIQLDYKLHKGKSSHFNQKMFGRINYSKKNKEKGFYTSGILDNIPYFRIFDGRIFISTCYTAEFDPIIKFCQKFSISTVVKNDDDIFMKTGKEKWIFYALERGVKIDWD